MMQTDGEETDGAPDSLRAVLKLEWIGEGHSDALHRLDTFRQEHPDHHVQTPDWLTGYDRRRFKPWVARLAGLHETLGFQREFVKGQIDYSRARTSCNRGVYLYFALPPGLYEVNAPQSWRHVRRYFCRVHPDATTTEVDRQEAMRCLLNPQPPTPPTTAHDVA